MIELSNRATVLAAFILPAGNGMKPHGLVLASHPYKDDRVEYITWEIYHDGEQMHHGPIWECEQGHYFQPSLVDNRDLADQDFGMRLSRLLTRRQLGGVTGTMGTRIG